ncbi:hypothetical protein PISMIDRAFT_177206 [Pisolithus microcarpus 441]|uniref:Unplaced genomic scaffold scaffold_113, whole genome shotgun sequence n=1 Tax=Pisolithus microcarpus 441 TaxID=765257 RepID=A0A0C9YXX7_9AGAM|nr:hypothetical protein PISMIDRAFT_177206 [Pisolithus microcarpus 441]
MFRFNDLPSPQILCCHRDTFFRVWNGSRIWPPPSTALASTSNPAVIRNTLFYVRNYSAENHRHHVQSRSPYVRARIGWDHTIIAHPRQNLHSSCTYQNICLLLLPEGSRVYQVSSSVRFSRKKLLPTVTGTSDILTLSLQG